MIKKQILSQRYKRKQLGVPTTSLRIRNLKLYKKNGEKWEEIVAAPVTA